MPDITNLATNTTCIAKINEVKNKILNITYLATATTLVVENKIVNVTNLVKKADYDANIPEMDTKYFKTSLSLVDINN